MNTIINIIGREVGAIVHAMRSAVRGWRDYRFLYGGWRNPDESPF